ncbi:DNA/RNA helicase [Pullulanibacillus camelliae]|uniref:DNA/RNA helicase n=1 Tax=Pullulanibacillus camelliae TaxID=1707096 RepID=A0A8J2VQV3_9BACL|nr:DNA/RNA helicase [Pullulanibacillus camelliae]
MIRPQWKGELTSLQQHAAEQLVAAVRKKENFLLWAVCGSGKTEVLYPAITEAIREGLRIAIVAPRTDVVIELSKRLKRVFAEVPINLLYGESPEHFHPAPITLATTHQLLHFYDYFDCVFIDEVDAFPFHNNDMLHYALHQAAKTPAPHFYLTATPSKTLKSDYRHGKIKGVRIPIRFHGHPLPTLRFKWIGSWKKQLNSKRLPKRLKDWMNQQLKSGRQAFLFVPSIETLEQLDPLVSKMNHLIVSVHADDPERHQKVEAFRQGEIRLLVTTTILERGVTIPALDVAILGADAVIFDERALVQIAGRVGRAADYPDGSVILFHHGITRQMQRAKQHIENMNRLAFDKNSVKASKNKKFP